MANYRAIAAGNWSNPATWDGGSVPPNSEGHNVYANNFTVTIDTSINVAILTNAAITAAFVGGGTSAAVGGTFNLNDGITVNATSINATSPATAFPTILYSGSTSATITASTAINAGTTNGHHAIRHAGTGTLTITGNCNGGGSSGQAGHAAYLSGTGTINLTGNLVGGSGSVGIDSLGGTAVVNKSSGSGIINVTGNVTGAVGQGHGIANITGGTVNVLNGNVTSTGAGNGILQNSSGAILSVNGNVTAGASAIAINATAGTVTVVGNCTATNGFPAISSITTVRASGSFTYSSNGTVPISAPRIILNATPALAKTRYALDGAGTYVDMFTADNPGLGPATNHVRAGVSYGGGLTGTLAVPPAGAVALGVPVDNTTGSAILTQADVQAALTAQGLTTARAGNLDNLDTTVSSRLAPSGTLATVTTLTNAPASVTADDIWSYATRTITGGTVDTLTNAPTVPSASAIASQVRTELSVELGRVDAAISTRATPANIPTADISAIRAKTDALNTARLGQCATTESTGDQLASLL